MMIVNTILQGHVLDRLRALPDESIDCCITSPPYYGLRTYEVEPVIWGWGDESTCNHQWKKEIAKHDNLRPSKVTEHAQVWSNQCLKFRTGSLVESFVCEICGAWKGDLGAEPSLSLFVDHLIQVFREVHRVLKKSGTCWVVIADSYGGSGSPGGDFKDGKGGDYYLRPYNRGGVAPKSLCMIPFRFAIGMVERIGFILRNDIIWHKNNSMPSSVTDRFTIDFEHVLFFSKTGKYYFNRQTEPYKISSVERLYRGASDHAKWVLGPKGQTPHTMNMPRPNRRLNRIYSFDGMEQTGAAGLNGYEEPNWVKVGRNMRAVWSIPTHASNYDFCLKCRTLFWGHDKKRIILLERKNGNRRVMQCPVCGDTSSWVEHFAPFPTTLVARMIDAGCPKEVCTVCGQPRIIKTIRKKIPAWSGKENRIVRALNVSASSVLRIGGARYSKWKLEHPDKEEIYTMCRCGASFRPGIVLDPFMGSGTTAVEAERAGVSWIGIELSPQYAALAEARVKQEREKRQMVNYQRLKPLACRRGYYEHSQHYAG